MPDKNIPTLILVGGFLGAGKTTLIASAAGLLQKRGTRTAVIMNDQDAGLVDSRFTAAQDLATREIAGGCFCCRFSDLLDAADQLRSYAPDIIFAEPVGSCIDLSATVLNPLKAYYRDDYRVAPLTVLLDPDFAGRVYRGEIDEDSSYLFRNQVAEADVICTTKRDLYPSAPALPIPVDFELSGRTGEGIEDWLNEILEGRRVAGPRILDVDYGRYGKAEAAMGWLNLHAGVRSAQPIGPLQLVGPLLDDLDQSLTAEGIRVAHLKAFAQSGASYVKASICANGEEPVPDGDLTAEPATTHELVINLRAVSSPDRLKQIVMRAVERIDGSLDIKHLSAFSPPQPTPEHRLPSAV